MPIFLDPDTRQRVLHSKHCGDIQYDLAGDSVITNESVPVIGPWQDNTGSGGPPSVAQQRWAGLVNQFKNTDEGLDGAKLPNLNEVGENADIYRRRLIRRHKELGAENKA